MSDDSNVDLAFLGRAIERLTDEVATMRDDIAVMAAILNRQDSTITKLLVEIRATHSQHQRLANRVTKLELRGDADPDRPPA